MHSKRLACAAAIVGALLVSGPLRAQSLIQDTASGADALPSVIPIFPLEDAMLFPGVSRPLHIFEPRYRAMVAAALKGDRIIGMVTLRPGYEPNYEGRPPVYPIGCAGEITDFERLPDGRYNIVLRGLVKFRVVDEDQSQLYRRARVDALPEVPDEGDKEALHKQRQRLEALVTDPGSDRKVPPEVPDVEVVNAIAEYVPIAAGERQGLLELPGVLSRSQKLIELLGPKPESPR
jgi:Lon protease-like protein